jgi:hypothetical protein
MKPIGLNPVNKITKETRHFKFPDPALPVLFKYLGKFNR